MSPRRFRRGLVAGRLAFQGQGWQLFSATRVLSQFPPATDCPNRCQKCQKFVLRLRRRQWDSQGGIDAGHNWQIWSYHFTPVISGTIYFHSSHLFSFSAFFFDAFSCIFKFLANLGTSLSDSCLNHWFCVCFLRWGCTLNTTATDSRGLRDGKKVGLGWWQADIC